MDSIIVRTGVESNVILDLNIDERGFEFSTSIEDALVQAENELTLLNETIGSIKNLNQTVIN